MFELKINVNGDNHLLVRNTLIPLRKSILKEIDTAPKGTIFYYDFSSIGGINTSGVDEIIAKVLNCLITQQEDKYLILTNLQDDDYEHRFNIDSALERLDVGVIEQLASGMANFLGKISSTHKELLTVIYREKNVTARYIADLEDKKITLISTHLNKLYSNRLIRRTEEILSDGGRQYIYTSLF